jgi:hypothetical protein
MKKINYLEIEPDPYLMPGWHRGGVDSDGKFISDSFLGEDPKGSDLDESLFYVTPNGQIWGDIPIEASLITTLDGCHFVVVFENGEFLGRAGCKTLWPEEASRFSQASFAILIANTNGIWFPLGANYQPRCAI